ncbi:antirestriction protein ArdA [Picosynechococcus sp. PCC 7117]|uniref:antirestriction protein ArdA n=1 Tax=Picosynechococcus sp. PCC 7117 TaxID=195498 RepID=UPI0008103F9E|nr:antirestriction protein ArdA [Picosynechococcus sp. PCC 7117]ANV88901.1 antirestriction protein [Picosynechococcus sp. PCC 7117]
MLTLTDTPRIYVACLAAYNNGFLHGAWIDADQDAEDIRKEVREMLKTFPAWKLSDICEEWAIHDYDNFGNIHLSEWEDFETVSALAQAIANHGPAFAAFYGTARYGDVASTVEAFEDAYQGIYDDKEDFVYSQLEDLGTLDAWEKAGMMTCYIDFAAIARDWFITDYFAEPTPKHQVYVFAYL